MERRDFLKSAAFGLTSCCCAPLFDLLNKATLGPAVAAADTATTCFTAEQMLAFFDKYVVYEKDLWIKYYGDDTAEELLSQARDELALLAPSMPCIQDSQDSLKHSYNGLAKYKVLKQYGTPLEDIASMYLGGIANGLFSIPWFIRLFIGLGMFNKSTKDAVKNSALESQKRENPDDWVFEYVEGDGFFFDYGMNFYECPIVKCFPRHDAAEFSKYICPSDDVVSDAFGRGLVRTSTLALGGEVCDFRMKWKLPRLRPRADYSTIRTGIKLF